MSDHYQVASPFEGGLAEEMEVGGRTVKGAKARLLDLLQRTRDEQRSYAIGRHQGPAGWVPRHLLVEPWSGGMEGARRLRELREEYGVAYGCEPFEVAGEASATWIYRLSGSVAGMSPSPKPAQAQPPAPAHAAVRLDLRYAIYPQEQGLPAQLVVELLRGGHFLAVERAALLAAEMDGPEAADRLYLEQLRAAYSEGRFRALELVRTLALVWPPEAAIAERWSPVPVICAALDKLGAQRVDRLEGRAA
jgi:hypothetical protein